MAIVQRIPSAGSFSEEFHSTAVCCVARDATTKGGL